MEEATESTWRLEQRTAGSFPALLEPNFGPWRAGGSWGDPTVRFVLLRSPEPASRCLNSAASRSDAPCALPSALTATFSIVFFTQSTNRFRFQMFSLNLVQISFNFEFPSSRMMFLNSVII